ncbi:MAG: tyrosine-type recombinase/integrase, partial [Betaproteobacteria bacterium]|nr:tyrosine-type recombinase/integrase [Betaproteobacteria bacterium]
MKFPESLENHRRAFLEALRVRNFSPATLRSRGQSLDAFFRFLSSLPPTSGGRGLDDVREVSAETIHDYQLFLSRQPWTTHTVHAKLMALRQFFRHLEKTDAVLVNPCSKMVLPRLGERLPRNVLTPAEARRILDQPDTQTRKGIRDKAILEVFYSTGIRLEEMSRLTTHDVDTRNGFLRVNQGKFAKDRVVPLGRKASDYVREYLQKVRSEWSKEKKDERALWLSSIQPYAPLKKQLIGVMVRQYGQAALGLPAARQAGRSVSPHVWRHTCATHLVAGGSN